MTRKKAQRKSEPRLKHQADCSRACVHAGLAALVAAGFGITVLLLLYRLPEMDAYGEYVGRRLALSNAVANLIADECWTRLQADTTIEPPIKLTPIAKLKDFGCVIPLTNAKVVGVTADGRETKPATNLRLTGPFQTARDLAAAFEKALEPQLLEAARAAEARFDYAIYRWRSQIRFIHVRRAPGSIVAIDGNTSEVEHERRWISQFVSALTVEDLEEISNFEPVTIEAFDDAAQDFRRVGVPGFAGTGLRVETAAIVIQSIIWVCFGWVWLNVREVSAPGGNVEPGTVFAMFTRTPASRLFFRLLLCFPIIVTALIAFRTPTMKVAAVSIAVLTLVAAKRSEVLTTRLSPPDS